MTDKVKATIKKYNMLEDGERVCAALSGGADSVSLMLCLAELGYSVFAVHVNHNLRGSDSENDEKFCRSLCKRLGIEFFSESVDVRGYCQKNKVSLEQGARILRYRAIEKHLCGAKLATAHNLNDCFETTLFNLIRGTGLKGLLGIPPVRGNIIRPLIEVSRQEILDYLSKCGQDYVTDITNFSDDCSRNIIRLNVIPQLQRINPSLLKTYSCELKNFAEAQSFVSSAADELLMRIRTDNGYDFLGVSDSAAFSLAISKMLEENGIEPSGERIERVKLLINSGGKLNIAKDIFVLSDSGRVTFKKSSCDAPPSEICCAAPGEYLFAGSIVRFTEISQFHISDYNKESLKSIVDSEKISGGLRIRSYIGSEKITLPGRNFNSTVKKLLSVYPADGRKNAAVIADEKGAIFVQGFGAAKRVFCSENTSCAIQIDIIDRKGD